MSYKVLFVDDDPNVLAGCQRNLRRRFNIYTALGGEKALELMRMEGPFAVVVADMQMPHMNGVQLLQKVQQQAADTIRIMLTGNADQKTARDAVNHGHIFRFLNKPCPSDEITATLEAALRQYALVTAERELLERTLNGSVNMLTNILSMLNPDIFGQSQRLREYMAAFARSFNIAQTWDLELAAMLSQIGYVTLPPALLDKVRAGHGLTGAEKDTLARISQIGADLVGNIPRLESVANVIRYQNKNFDGSGTPADDLAGESIPIGARILRVLRDLLDDERRRTPTHLVLEQMKRTTGFYDPKVIEAVASSLDIYVSDESETGAVDAVSFEELQVGVLLSADLQTSDGTMIVGAGTVITPTLLEKLRNFQSLTGIREPIEVVANRSAREQAATPDMREAVESVGG